MVTVNCNQPPSTYVCLFLTHFEISHFLQIKQNILINSVINWHILTYSINVKSNNSSRKIGNIRKRVYSNRNFGVYKFFKIYRNLSFDRKRVLQKRGCHCRFQSSWMSFYKEDEWHVNFRWIVSFTFLFNTFSSFDIIVFAWYHELRDTGSISLF